MAFGLNQIKNPTPATATWLFRIVLYLSGLGNIAIIAFTNISPELKLNIVSWSSFATLAIHSASKMFGIPLPEDSSVKSEDVASLKTDNPKVTP